MLGRCVCLFVCWYLIYPDWNFSWIFRFLQTDWLTDWMNDVVNPWSRVLPEKLTRPQLVKKFPRPFFSGFFASCKLTDWLNEWRSKSMEQSPSWEANTSSASQEIRPSPFLVDFSLPANWLTDWMMTEWRTNSMEQIPSWEANTSSASQEIPPPHFFFLWIFRFLQTDWLTEWMT